MTQVLITGVTSAYGSTLARRLRERGDRVRGLVFHGDDSPLAPEPLDEVVIGDVRDRSIVDRAVAGCDLVFHLAALYQSEKAPDRDFFEVNLEGTRHVLEAARRHGVRRTVHVSTVGVHGHISTPPANEEAPYQPLDPYQRSKLEGEILALSYFREGLEGTVVRPAAIYGPGDLRFLKLFRGVQQGWFAMLGPGKALYHMVYVDDLAEATLRCADSDAARGEVFIVAGDEVLPVGKLVERVAAALGVSPPRLRLPLWPFQLAAPVCQRVCRAIGVEPPLYPRRLEFFTVDRAFDVSKARTVLGFAPKVGLDEGLRRTLQWYRERGLLR